MWWREHAAPVWRLIRPALALAVAGLLAACFQPLYAERPQTGGPSLRGALAAVDVEQIDVPRGTPESRVAVELRNALLFDLTGGGGSIAPTHRLKMIMTVSKSALIVDVNTGRTQDEVTGIDVAYTLIDLASKRVVVNGSGFARVSTDIPGEQQRFALWRAHRDAEDRAAKVVADQIAARLASFFVAGT
jgi:LPS-assembly lipoprotein